jgi:type VI secretion system protein ImpK
MTPKFAQAVDPIFLHILNLVERIGRDERPAPQDERLRIVALVDQAEAILGGGEEWDLAKYALVSWTDELLLESPWEGRDWWTNNLLEVELFNSRLCNELFYERAREAAALARRDALEVYYVCVVLGFRGLYRDANLAYMLTQQHDLPADLDTWARQTSLAIRLGQGRPPLAPPRREILGAPPLSARPLVVWSWLAAVLLAAGAALCYAFLFQGS